MPITKTLPDLVEFAKEQIYLRGQDRHTMYIPAASACSWRGWQAASFWWVRCIVYNTLV